MTYEFKINCEINNKKYKKGDIVPEGVQYFPATMKVVNESEEIKTEAPKTDTQQNRGRAGGSRQTPKVDEEDSNPVVPDKTPIEEKGEEPESNQDSSKTPADPNTDETLKTKDEPKQK